jgi:uncharacterized protein (DUF1778 family)
MKTIVKSRFDTRLPKEQKEYFEYAANLGGFRNLTEFMIFSAQQQANIIVENRNAILASKMDQEIFFEAIMKPSRPNSKLKKAVTRYNQAIAKK